MDRFSRFRRHKKGGATAAAAAATTTLDAPATAAAPATTAAPQEINTGTEVSAPDAAAAQVLEPEAAAPPTLAPTSYKAPTETSADSRPTSRASQSPSHSSSLVGANGATSSPPQPQEQQKAQPQKRNPLRSSRSPFRHLLRSSTKRSRAAPTPSTVPALPKSPTAGLSSQFQNIAFTAGNSNGTAQTSAKSKDKRSSARSTSADRKPKLPHFLNLSLHEIEHKFHELVWLERNRIQSSMLSPTGPWTRVTGPHLKTLDRYMNIQPWDKNRVRLQVPPGRVDYINASPIVLTTTAPAHAARPPDRYIAMQGPKQSSVDHVWRMVYEQLRSPAVIVMLTETHEANQEKCYPYFPRHPDDPPMIINEQDEFGDGFHASVRCAAIEETDYGDAIELRRIVLRVHRKADINEATEGPSKGGGTAVVATAKEDPANGAKTGGLILAAAQAANKKDGESTGEDAEMVEASQAEAAMPSLTESSEDGTSKSINIDDYEDERIVYHFLYKRWPDFGVPALDDVEAFLGLMRLSAEKNADADNPRIVHCSAGVGRSGTFIALEHLLRELDAGVLENYDDDDDDVAGDAEGEDESMTGTEGPQGSAAASSTGAGVAGAESGGSGSGGSDASGPDNDVAQEGGTADDLIFNTVNQLREQRRTMVQADAQYLFIYQVLRRLWEDKYGAAGDDGSGDGGDNQDGGPVHEAASQKSDASEPAAKRLEVDPFTDKK